MKKYRISLLLAVVSGTLVASQAQAGSWQNNAPFGASLNGDLYTPGTPGPSPAILVAIHYCTGNKSVVHSWFESYAEKNGFYIIAPDAGKQCFDSSASRDGDKAAIVNMVNYVITQKGADKTRVFAAGLSSGGCMTNTLLAIYPDVFAGGAAMPGFPAGGWPAGDTSCTKCGSSPSSTDGKYWGDMARKAFTWSGARPCVQQWVGGADEYNFNGYLPAVAAQFQNLMNLDSGSAGSGAPSGWTRKEYKDSSGHVMLQTNLGPSGQKHDLSGANLWGQVVSFLGLDKPTGACGLTGTSSGGDGGTSTGAGGSAGGPSTGKGGAKTDGGLGTGGKPDGAGGSSGSETATGGSANVGGKSGGSGGSTRTTTGSSKGGATGAGGARETGGKSSASASGGTAQSSAGSTKSSKGGSSTTSGQNPSEETGGSGADEDNEPQGGGCNLAMHANLGHFGAVAGLAALGGLLSRKRRRDSRNK